MSVVKRVDGLLVEGIKIKEEGRSPLKYRGSRVQRLVLYDSGVKESSTHPYFADLPVSAVAFLDYQEYSEGVFIHYFSVRPDQRRRGHGRKIIEHIYKKYSDVDVVNWGKMMEPEVGKLFQSMKSKYTSPYSIGKVYY